MPVTFRRVCIQALGPGHSLSGACIDLAFLSPSLTKHCSSWSRACRARAHVSAFLVLVQLRGETQFLGKHRGRCRRNGGARNEQDCGQGCPSGETPGGRERPWPGGRRPAAHVSAVEVSRVQRLELTAGASGGPDRGEVALTRVPGVHRTQCVRLCVHAWTFSYLFFFMWAGGMLRSNPGSHRSRASARPLSRVPGLPLQHSLDVSDSFPASDL